MKKIVFFSLEDGWLGGIARVNEALQPALREKGLLIKNLFLRGCDYPLPPSPFNTVLRKDAPWRFLSGGQMLCRTKKEGIRAVPSLLRERRNQTRRYKEDLRAARSYLEREAPDCIVVTHYLLLAAVPKAYLSRTLYHVHTSFDATFSHRENRRALKKYNGKIGFVWLSEGICRAAERAGFAPSFFLYNPLSEFPEDAGDAAEQRTVSVIARFSEEKRLPLAVSLLQKAMDLLPEKAVRVEFWGTGPEEEALQRAIGKDERFHLMGHTSTPFEIWKKSRIGVNTSRFEGFSISVLEAAACGVPTVSFDFGEAAKEEILNEKTGLLVPMDDTDAFVKALLSLLTDDALLSRLSRGAREHASRFRAEAIAEDWLALLSRLPLDKKENP